MLTTFTSPATKNLKNKNKHPWKNKLFAEQKKCTATLNKNRQFFHKAMTIVSNLIYAIPGIPLFSSSNTISCCATCFVRIEMFLIQCYNSIILLGYSHTCNEAVICLSTLENTLQNRRSWKYNFLRLGINAHRKQSFFAFQELHCL